MLRVLKIPGLAALLTVYSVGAVRADSDSVISGIVGGLIAAGVSETASESNGASSVKTRPQPPRKKAIPTEANREVQVALLYFGFNPGSVDGIMGGQTQQAISQFQLFMGYAPTGQISQFERNFLLSSQREAVAKEVSGSSLTPREQLLAIRDGKYPTEVQVTSPSAKKVAGEATPDQASLDKLIVSFQDIQSQISLLRSMLDHQKTKPQDPTREVVIQAINDALSGYEVSGREIVDTAQRDYQTPIYPDNGNQGISSLKASEVFPKIPYYVLGTSETGEMWVVPTVTDDGLLKYMFNFMDPKAEYGKVRETIEMDASVITDLSAAFKKVEQWSERAQKAEIRRSFQKRAYCFPASDCGDRRVGVSSTEIVFSIYEDGSTSAKVQRNKGTFISAYNLSIQSAMLLSAYLDYMQEIGSKEFNAGSMTDADLDAMFEQ